MPWLFSRGQNVVICSIMLKVLSVLLICFYGSYSVIATNTAPGESASRVANDVRQGESASNHVDETVIDQEGDDDSMKRRMKLYRYDPVEVGHIRYVEISTGRYVHMKTIAVKPPAFEIPHFLTPDECETLKSLALEQGLASSTTVSLDLASIGIDVTKVSYDPSEWEPKITEYDTNADEKLDFVEVLQCLPGIEDGEIPPARILDRLYSELSIDLNSDGFIEAKELWLINIENTTSAIKNWLSAWRAGKKTGFNGRGRSRISEQAWLDWGSSDLTIKKLQDRLRALTKLDRKIIESSEDIQVARYFPGGHYHAHWDTDKVRPDKRCDHTSRTDDDPQSNNTRICRYITVMYYLSDVEEGGETAFPKANFDDYSQQLDYDFIDLSQHCHKNLYVKPEYGKAVMWYNSHIDKESGWVSSLDKHSLHGGCDVIKGIKWIANNWINVDDVYERQMKFHARKFPDANDNSDTDNPSDDHATSNTISVENENESAPSIDNTEGDNSQHGHSEL